MERQVAREAAVGRDLEPPRIVGEPEPAPEPERAAAASTGGRGGSDLADGSDRGDPDGLLGPQDPNEVLMQAAREAVRGGPVQLLDLGTGQLRYRR